MTDIDRGASPPKRTKGFLARWFEAMAEARMRHAEHEIHQHIPDEHEDEARRTGNSGGKGH